MEGHQLMDWLRSRWDWIVRNKFVTCVIVFAVGLLVFGVVMVCRHWGWIVTESGSTIIRNLGLVIGGLIAIGFGIWRGVVAGRQAKTSQRGLLNERYQRGAEMLGSPVLAVRLGGIYALHRLVEEEPERYHVQIMRLLCAFVRNPTKDDNARPSGGALGSGIIDYLLRQDVQAAVTAIGTRSDTDVELEKKENFHLLLSCANLSGAYLQRANLSHAILFDTDLSRAYLERANLSDARLSYANLFAVMKLTQDQLDQARADPANPPKLDKAYDAETDLPLEWRGKPLGK